jgi:hypothetical protein
MVPAVPAGFFVKIRENPADTAIPWAANEVKVNKYLALNKVAYN